MNLGSITVKYDSSAPCDFSKFQRFWKNQEIQDGGSKMSAILNLT